MSNCKTCSAEFRPANRRHVTCLVCQIIRDLSFVVASRRCRACGDQFWPSKRAWFKCPKCVDPAYLPHPNPDQACALCHKPNPPAPGLEKTCFACVQSSKDMAERYLASLLKKRGVQ